MRRGMMVGGWIFVVGAVCGLASPSAFAQDPLHKVGRGATNVLTSWIELPKNIHQGMLEMNPLAGVAAGLLRGTGLFVTRLALGAYEVVTCPIPYPKRYASPYEALELPDYPWE